MNLWMCVSQDGKAAVGSACVCRWCGLSIILKHFPELICETCKLWQFGMCVPKPGKLCTGRYWATPELWETCLPLRVKLWMWPFPSSHLLLGCGFSLETKKWSNTFWDHFVPGSEDTDSLCLEIPFGPRHCDLRFIPSTCSPLGCWPCIWPLAAQRLSGWACEVWRVCSTHESAQPLMLVKWKFKTTCTTLQRERLYIDIKIHICIYIYYICIYQFHSFHHFSWSAIWWCLQARLRLSAMESAGAGKDLTAVEVRHQRMWALLALLNCGTARWLTRVCWAES